jgi:hypothetical protein
MGNTTNYKTYSIKSMERVPMGNILYYLSLVLWTIITQLNSSTITTIISFEKSSITSVLVKVVQILLITKILFFTRYTIREIIKLIIGIVFAVIITYYSETKDILFLFLFIVAIKNLRLRNVAQVIFYSLMTTTIIIIGLSLTGAIVNVIFTRNIRVGFGMGFNHPNVFGHIMLSICILQVYLRYNKLRIHDYIFLLTMLFVTWEATKSRSTISMMILLIFLLILKKVINTYYMYEILKRISKIVIIASPIITIILGIIYSNSNLLLVKINNLLSDRILWENIYYKMYGIKMFGTNMVNNSSAEIYTSNYNVQVLDNAYMNYIIHYGVVFLITFVLMYYFLVDHTNKKYTSLILSIFIVFLSGISDNYILSIPYNFTLLGFGNILYEDYKINKWKINI